VIESLHLKRFKNFQDATLTLGPLTILIGANASGKSNIRDAFLFLHGIGRGYNLAEILGEKYIGGERAWSGIRGGLREVAYLGSDSFELGFHSALSSKASPARPYREYRIEVSVGIEGAKPPRIISESLWGLGSIVRRESADTFEVGFKTLSKLYKNSIFVSLYPSKLGAKKNPTARPYSYHAPVVFQVAVDDEADSKGGRAFSRMIVQELESFRFLDLSPAQMRVPSLLGLTTLGDRGENLSSVLAAICEDPAQKEVLLAWVRKLTPMDVDDLRFDQDAAGRILLRLVEKDGRSVSALSASDGTLRFLAILAAIFGPEPASFYFIEELENGIHPTRLGLLVDLIEHQAKRRNIQIVATSHSPQLLQFLSEESLEHASLVYRLPDHPDGRIKRIVDIPEARRVIREQPVWVLHASSWFEDALDLTEDADAEPVAGNQPSS
jgi:predicted ATPase